MAFTAADVKKLREMTSVGMMECKKALTEADGDFDKAIELLREKELGGEIKLVKCVRFERGEGIEKKQDDFAAEVASMAK